MAIIDIKLLPWFAICCQWLKQRGALWRIRWKFRLYLLQYGADVDVADATRRRVHYRKHDVIHKTGSI